MGNHLFVIFAVLAVSFAVTSCLNRSFFTFIRNNDHWPLRRITFLSGLLVPLGLNLAHYFVESLGYPHPAFST